MKTAAPKPKKVKTQKVKWACPSCGAREHKHGEGGADACEDMHAPASGCEGFICECIELSSYDTRAEAKDHGQPSNPCGNARCYHCGWEGEFPVPTYCPAALKGWARKAWDAGWRPPVGWKPGKAE